MCSAGMEELAVVAVTGGCGGGGTLGRFLGFGTGRALGKVAK